MVVAQVCRTGLFLLVISNSIKFPDILCSEPKLNTDRNHKIGEPEVCQYLPARPFYCM